MSLANNTMLTSLKLLVTRLQPKRCVNAWIVAILLVSLVGCSQPSTVSSLHALHERVAFTLDIELTPLTFEPRPPQLPDVRVLKPTASTPTMRFLTALQLNHCRAGQLIAERNSALGRLDDGFSRFQDDQSLIKALRQCAKSPQSEAFAAELITAAQQLSDTTSARLARALATDKGLRHALTMAATPLVTISDTEFIHSINALNAVTSWLEEPNTAVDLNEPLKVLAQENYLPQLMRSIAEYSVLLTQFSEQLDNIAQPAGCLSKGIPERAHRLHSAFISVFIKQTQGDLADIQRQYQRFSEALNTLAMKAPQPELKHYLNQWALYDARLTQATKSFVQPWQQFFEACGFKAGR